MEWLDTYSDPSVKAASVVTNLWIAAFAVCSACFALLGSVVALQWPNPRVLCYKTPHSDMPTNSLRSCCSLYSLNLGFSVFWLLVFAIMVIARDVVRIAVCLAFCLLHVAVVIVFRMKFKRHGRPERPYNPSAELMPGISGAAGGGGGSFAPATSLAPGQAVGIPVYNIPMQTVVIGGRSDGAGGAGGGAAGGPVGGQPGQQQWSAFPDADCLPPAQQQMVGGAGGGAAAAAAGSALPPSYAYPPQLSSDAAAGATGGAGGAPFVLGQPVTGVPAAAAAGAPFGGAPARAVAPAVPAGGGGAAAAQRASMDAVRGAAGAAAVAGAGTGAVGRLQQ